MSEANKPTQRYDIDTSSMAGFNGFAQAKPQQQRGVDYDTYPESMRGVQSGAPATPKNNKI